MRTGRSEAGRDPTDSSFHWWETTQAEQDHVDVPLGRNWRIAGLIIGAIVVTFLVTVVLAESDDEPVEYRAIVPTALETDAIEEPIVTGVDVGIAAAKPDEGRVRVDGDGLVRVDIAGDALCAPVSGAAAAWIDIRLCGPVATLTITARDDEGGVTTAVARF